MCTLSTVWPQLTGCSKRTCSRALILAPLTDGKLRYKRGQVMCAGPQGEGVAALQGEHRAGVYTPQAALPLLSDQAARQWGHKQLDGRTSV